MPDHLPKTKTPQLNQDIYTQQQNPNKTPEGVTDVLQDRVALMRGRIASMEAASRQQTMRSHGKNTKYPRTKNKHVVKRRTVPLTLHPEPILKTKVQNKAAAAGISVSQAGLAFMKKGMQADLDMEYGVLLEPALERILTRLLGNANRYQALLLVRAIFASEQDRSISTNILSRLPGVTPEVLSDILNRAAEEARAKITQTTPPIEDLIAEVKSWFEKDEKKEKEKKEGGKRT
jgi:hypothetical protein